MVILIFLVGRLEFATGYHSRGVINHVTMPGLINPDHTPLCHESCLYTGVIVKALYSIIAGAVFLINPDHTPLCNEY